MLYRKFLPEDLTGRDFVRLAVLFLVYYFLFQFYVRFLLEFFPDFTQGAPYFSFSIVLTSINKLGGLLAYALLLTVFLVTYFRTDWKAVGGSKIRYFVTFLAIVLAWSFSTYGYNYFLNQGHYLDRLIVLSLGLLTFIHPSFLTLLLGTATIVGSQFNQGMFMLREVEERLLLSILIMVVAYLLVRSFSDTDDGECLFGILVVTAANYFGPGLVKLLNGDSFLGWFYYYNLVYDFGWKHYVGWLAGFPSWLIDGVIVLLKTFNTPILLAIVVVEVSALLLLYRRRLTISILVGFCCLHLGFLLLSGVFFAKWIIVVLALILLLTQLDETFLKNFYRRYRIIFPLFVVLVTVSGLVPSRNIVWGGTKYNLAFDMIGVNDRGEEYPISERSFSPYGRFFAQSHMNFTFLIRDQKILGPSYVNFRVAEELNRLLTSPDRVEPVKEKLGFVPYDPKRTDFFRRFVKTYLVNYYDGSQSSPFSYLQFPMRYLSVLSSEKYSLEEVPGRLRTLRIRAREAYFNGNRNIPIRSRVVQEISIPQSSRQ